MEKLVPYYERELSMLRRASAEFAGRYPKLAGILRMCGESCADPHVEPLIQSSAFLNTRVDHLPDDGYAHFIEALLGMLYPHLMPPIPSCSIARIETSGALKAMGRGAVVRHFRTVYDTVVAPVNISAGFEPYPHKLPPLRAAIFLDTVGTRVEADGHWRMLERLPLQAAGLAVEEALLPATTPEHGAYLLLSEYFAFPEKFEFIGIDLAALTAAAPEGSTELPLRLLRDVRHDTPEARILHTLGADNLLLGCAPIVNLFPLPATPIRITPHVQQLPAADAGRSVGAGRHVASLRAAGHYR